MTLHEIFSYYVDITAAPTRYFFYALSCHTDDELHRKKLREFSSRTLEAKDALYEYCKREKRSAAEVMWDFWTARPPLAELLSALPLMRPRRYSIASCPRWFDPGLSADVAARFWASYQRSCGPWLRRQLNTRLTERCFAEALTRLSQSSEEKRGAVFDLCVAVVKSTTKTGREFVGLCSSYLQKSAVGSSIVCSFET